jgi:hypothetical protein
VQTSDSSSGADRRQNPRTKLVEIAYIGMGPENGGLVLDVSEGGLSFHSVAPIQRDEKVEFLLSLRGHSRIEGTGEVVWTNNVGTVCGLRFTSLSPGALEHLNNWKVQSNTSAPPARAKSVAPAPPIVMPAPAAAKSSILKIESPTPVFAITPPAAEREHSVHITEVRGQSPLFWMAVGALTTAFASAAFFYGMRVGKAYYNAPPAAATVTDTRPQPTAAPSLPAALPQNAVASPRQPVSAPAASQSARSAPSQTFVNASRTEGIPDSSGPAIRPNSSAAPAAVHPSGSASSAPSAAPSAPTAIQGAQKVSAEDAKPTQIPAANPRLSPDDGKSEYAAALANLNGDNGKRDTTAAIQLLQIASKKGDTLAEVTLADLYIYGDGVAQDCVQGKSLLAEAAKSGSMQAKVKLDEITTDGCPQ